MLLASSPPRSSQPRPGRSWRGLLAAAAAAAVACSSTGEPAPATHADAGSADATTEARDAGAPTVFAAPCRDACANAAEARCTGDGDCVAACEANAAAFPSACATVEEEYLACLGKAPGAFACLEGNPVPNRDACVQEQLAVTACMQVAQRDAGTRDAGPGLDAGACGATGCVRNPSGDVLCSLEGKAFECCASTVPTGTCALLNLANDKAYYCCR